MSRSPQVRTRLTSHDTQSCDESHTARSYSARLPGLQTQSRPPVNSPESDPAEQRTPYHCFYEVCSCCQFMVWDAFDGVLCAAHRVPQYERMADLSGVRFHAVLYSCDRLGEKGKDTAQYMQRHPASFSGNDRLLSAAQTIYVSYLLPLSICFPYGNGFGRVSASGSLCGACEAA